MTIGIIGLQAAIGSAGGYGDLKGGKQTGVGDQFNPGPEHGLLEKIRNLNSLLAQAGAAARRNLRYAIALTTLATVADFAALGLLKQGAARFMPDSAVGRGAEASLLAGFLLAALIGSALRLVALRQTIATHGNIHRDLAIRAFNVLQRQDYEDFLRNGASHGFATFERLQILANISMTALVSLAVALLGASLLSCAVLWFYPAIGGVLLIVLAVVLAEAFWRDTKRTESPVSHLSQARARLIYEARSSFRDIFLANGQDRMCADFAQVEISFRTRQTQEAMSAQSSRNGIEIAGFMAALAMLAIVSGSQEPWQVHIAPLGIIALAAMRLVPQAATIRSSLRTIAFHGEVTRDILALFDRPGSQPTGELRVMPLELRERIELKDVMVKRKDRPVVLCGLDLAIVRGSRIGIAGASGAGKSTLLDVICGATIPDSGTVNVDETRIDRQSGRAWRDRIGMVSQTPLLLGSTLREAVTFPLRPEDCNPARFATAIGLAGIDTMTAAFARGLDTPIGEALAFLSGGQRQRLALAHALFRAKDLLILDEATGHLDHESEQAILEAIRQIPRDITMIVVSHREALFACCDVIYCLEDGKLVLAGSAPTQRATVQA